jgi:hypothetical protein
MYERAADEEKNARLVFKLCSPWELPVVIMTSSTIYATRASTSLPMKGFEANSSSSFGL